MGKVIMVGPGSVVEHAGRTYCVRRYSSANEVVAEDIDSGEKISLAISVIIHSNGKTAGHAVPDLAAITEHEWQEALHKYRAFKPLLEMHPRPTIKVQEVADKLLVDLTTVYRWIKRFEETRTITSLLRKRRSDRGAQKLSPEVEQMITGIINRHYLNNQQLSYTHAYRELQLACRAAKLEYPHFNTFIKRIKLLATELVVKRRRGQNEALKYQPVKGHFPGANYPYSVIQIDHTKLDIILVDEHDRIPIGRPYITLAIDTFSRMVVGFFISFDPPGTLGTGICISNTLLQKDELLSHYNLQYTWPCYGIPAAIHLDNAKEFRGDVLKKTCGQYGIDIKFRKVKKPNYGGYIERLLGTLLKEIHALPGTTFSNPEQRGEYDSVGKATMSLADLEKWLLNLICGAYHKRIHSELGTSPLERYDQGIMGTDDSPGVGQRPVAADELRLRIDFLPMELRTIQPGGVMIDCINYSADVLNRWVGAKGSGSRGRKFIFRRDPRDISYLLFYDPDAEAHFKVPYSDTRYPAMTLWEYKAVRRHLRELGKDKVNEEEIFRAFEDMKKVVEHSKVLKKQAKIKKERSATAPPPPAPERDTAPTPVPDFKRGKIELFELEE
ncbi:helix-turn-helix domain-containing protein [Geobacter sp. SVR]|uniref:helix-turn-helix domain-containing protein n=1 Tax=Geobacter sp. SVR TaxID=2495594 RepID=UPI00143EF618|nr:helix-turn-helix domain-containing protein [Geobacter sp. SVR]BCS51776.1 transposase [Geobacter sp. SVR]GCF87037.1 transposase [Geobacter sp. SVR]